MSRAHSTQRKEITVGGAGDGVGRKKAVVNRLFVPAPLKIKYST